MIPEELRHRFQNQIDQAESLREQVFNAMYEIQRHCGYLTDEGLQEAAALVGAPPLGMEDRSTFYNSICREPVGRFIPQACDGLVCWMFNEGSRFDYRCRKLGVCAGEVSACRLFTVDSSHWQVA